MRKKLLFGTYIAIIYNYLNIVGLYNEQLFHPKEMLYVAIHWNQFFLPILFDDPNGQ